MSTIRSRRAGGLLLVAVLVSVLAACGESAEGDVVPGATETLSAPEDDTTTGVDLALEAGTSALGYPSVLGGLTLDEGASAGLAWTEEPGLLYVVTLGSSTCPVVAEPEATTSGDGVLVTFVPVDEGDEVTACTADLVPTTTVVGLPDGAGEDTDLAVELEGIGSATIPARSVAGTDALVPVTAG